jgi:hypothetical protein
MMAAALRARASGGDGGREHCARLLQQAGALWGREISFVTGPSGT